MAQTIDGSVREADTGNANTLSTFAFNNASGNNILVADIFLEDQSGTGFATVSTVTSGALNLTRQSSAQIQFGILGSSFVTIERWWVLDPNPTSAAIVANFSRTVDDATIVAYSVNGCRTTAPVWDPGTNASKSNNGTSSIPSLSGFTTTYDKSMLLMAAASSSNTSSPGLNTAGTSPATFTLLNSFVNAANIAFLASANEQLIVSAVQSSISPNFGTSWADWLMLGDALLDASAVSSDTLQAQIWM